MTSIAELLDRVRAATGPDREIDGALALMEGWTFQKMEGDRVAYWRKPGATKGWDRATSGPPPYTASVDAALSLVERKLPGWTWRVASCSVSDDAWVCPDFNHPTYGADFLARFNDAFGGRDPAEAIIEVTDVDRRPAGQPALALIESLLLALELLNPEVKHDAR